jgi:thymidine kinase
MAMAIVEGNLQLIIGPMFSGKSTELIRRVRRYQHARLECLVVKYMFDDRYSEEYVAPCCCCCCCCCCCSPHAAAGVFG